MLYIVLNWKKAISLYHCILYRIVTALKESRFFISLSAYDRVTVWLKQRHNLAKRVLLQNKALSITPIALYLINIFVLAVIHCPIYHWLEVSHNTVVRKFLFFLLPSISQAVIVKVDQIVSISGQIQNMCGSGYMPQNIRMGR